MSLSSGRFQLSNAFKTLRHEWDSTENFWRDVVRKDFEETHWEPLAVRMNSVLTAMDRLDQALAKMKQECE